MAGLTVSGGDDRGDPGGALEPDPRDEELAVRTIELDTDDGGTVVVAQQNQAGRRQAGGGEWKNTDHAPAPDEAAREQAEVDASTGATADDRGSA